VIFKKFAKLCIKYVLDLFYMTEAAKKYYNICKKTSSSGSYTKLMIAAIKNSPNVVFVKTNAKDPLVKEATFFMESCKKARLELGDDDVFFYSPDFNILRIDVNRTDLLLGNITVDYKLILEQGILNIKQEINKYLIDDRYTKSLLIVCDAIDLYVKRILKFLETHHPERNDLIDLVSHVPLLPANSFKEALQSILLINSLMWIDNHPLIGLGRLDQILYRYYLNDIKDGNLSKEEAQSLLSVFIKTLHKGFKYKSNTLPGDTGQVIVLGGINYRGECDDNDLTGMFMGVMKDLKLPDPKIVLRVSSKTPQFVWEEAMSLLSEGLGYPLFSNDDVVVPALIQFGYEDVDAYNYVVSACWEPHIAGISFDQNNVYTINFLIPLQHIMKSRKQEIISLTNFNDFFSMYINELTRYVDKSIKEIETIKFRPSPLLSILTNCKNYDISCGGAKYSHFGLLSVGLSNTVDSLLNIMRYLNCRDHFSLLEIQEILESNYEGHEDLLYDLRTNGLKFGDDETEVLRITNALIDCVSRVLQGRQNPFGGKYKFGLSSPAFVESGKQMEATPDGRRRGEPLGVHISNHKETNYTSLFNFSSQLNYDKAFNGAVTDVVIDSGFLRKNFNNFLSLFKTFFIKGGLQLQCNVLDYTTLTKALKNPEEFPNLVVRVWGFSAYFKDLPKEYQELIVERARQYETNAFND